MAKPVNVLEIGSFEGRSAVEWLQGIPSLSVLCCVDPWPDETVYTRFQSNIRHARKLSASDAIVQAIRKPSAAVLAVEERKFDLVYIDGDHEARAIVADFVLCEKLLLPGSLVLFDDYHWQPHGQWSQDVPPKRAIDALLGIWGQYVEVITHGHQVLVKWTGRR